MSKTESNTETNTTAGIDTETMLNKFDAFHIEAGRIKLIADLIQACKGNEEHLDPESIRNAGLAIYDSACELEKIFNVVTDEWRTLRGFPQLQG